MAVEGHSSGSAARELGVSVGTVRRWVSDAVAQGAVPQQRASPMGTESASRPLGPLTKGHDPQLDEILRRIAALEAEVTAITQRQSQN